MGDGVYCGRKENQEVIYLTVNHTLEIMEAKNMVRSC